MSIEDSFFQLLRLGLELEDDAAICLKEEQWTALYNLMQAHALLGIGKAGLQRLTSHNMPRLLLLQWIGIAGQISQRNLLMDDAVKDISVKLENDGWQFAILKGQTVARFYPEPGLRQSGDIDVWIYGRKDASDVSRKEIIDYLEGKYNRVKLCYLHADGIRINGNVAVEFHFKPTFSVCPWRNVWLQRCLSGYVPGSYEFNRLYMLHHIFRHLLSEGIGLRQVVDYAMLLRHHHSGIDEAFCKILEKLGMLGFAKGIAWILKEKLYIPVDCLFCETDEDEGRYLLNEIMCSGNFGRADGSHLRNSNWRRFVSKVDRNRSFLRKYPFEVLWYIPFVVWETVFYKLPHR